MIVGGIEEIRLDEAANELYCADNYLGGRVMIFDLTTFAFKRGWGAYGHKLSEISTDDAEPARSMVGVLRLVTARPNWPNDSPISEKLSLAPGSTHRRAGPGSRAVGACARP